jgi:oligopeptide/dipeptide ABC transporter ATP-binding protein
MLKIDNLHVSFGITEVVRGISFEVNKGEIISILGESGSGKSVTAMSILKLYDPKVASITADHMLFSSHDLLKLEEKALRPLRGKHISYIFQNPNDALSPNRTIRAQFKELCKIHEMAYIEKEIIGLLKEVGLVQECEIVLNMYPHQLSGGQAQRVTIAMALLLKPEVLIADEPTSSIDASLTDVIVELLTRINKKLGITILFITHDFDLASRISHQILILYGGLVMEYGQRDDLFGKPLHPYTIELMKCVNSIHSQDEMLYTLAGNALDPSEFTMACPFALRCPLVEPRCTTQIPDLITRDNRTIRCVRFSGGVTNA